MLANAPTTRTMPFLLLAGSALGTTIKPVLYMYVKHNVCLASKATNGFATIDETNGASGLWWPINQQVTPNFIFRARKRRNLILKTNVLI